MADEDFPTRDSYPRYKIDTAYILAFNCNAIGSVIETDITPHNCRTIALQAQLVVNLGTTIIPDSVMTALRSTIKLRKEFLDWYSIRAEESDNAMMRRDNVTHAHFIEVMEFIQKLYRKERARVRGLASSTQNAVSPNNSGNTFSALENDINTDIFEPEDLLTEELEQLAITEEGSITMPDTPTEINEATAASIRQADMDMAVFCHKADEQKIVTHVRNIWHGVKEGRVSVMAGANIFDEACYLLDGMWRKFTETFPQLSTPTQLYNFMGYSEKWGMIPTHPQISFQHRTTEGPQIMTLQNQADILSPYGGLAMMTLRGAQLGEQPVFPDEYVRRLGLRPRPVNPTGILTWSLFNHTLENYTRWALLDPPIWLPIMFELSYDIFCIMGDARRTVLAALEVESRRLQADLVRIRELYVILGHRIITDEGCELTDMIERHLTAPAPREWREAMIVENGMLLYAIQTQRHKLGLVYGNIKATLLSAAHLYRFVRMHQPEEPSWPDMDLFMQMHGGNSTFRTRSLLINDTGPPLAVDRAFSQLCIALGTTLKEFENDDWIVVRRGREPWWLNNERHAQFGSQSELLNRLGEQAINDNVLGIDYTNTMHRVLHTYFERTSPPTAMQMLEKFTTLQRDGEPAFALDYLGFVLGCLEMFQSSKPLKFALTDTLMALRNASVLEDATIIADEWAAIKNNIPIAGRRGLRMAEAMTRLNSDVAAVEMLRARPEFTDIRGAQVFGSRDQFRVAGLLASANKLVRVHPRLHCIQSGSIALYQTRDVAAEVAGSIDRYGYTGDVDMDFAESRR